MYFNLCPFFFKLSLIICRMQIMSSYVSMFNSEWDKDTENKKHAIAAETCLWLQQSVVKEWRQTGLPFHSVKHVLCQEFVEADMVRLKS